MYLLKKPSAHQVGEFIERQSELDFTYPSVGITSSGDSPAGWVVDHNCIHLGSGEKSFQVASQMLGQWQHYRFDWLELCRPDAEPAPGQTMGVLARALGLWSLNACRLVYVVNEQQPLRRSAMAYGTLPDHAESGEERFQVEWRDDDSVWYDIFAFSRPHHWLSRIGHPYVRRKQKQFAKESLQAMKAAVEKGLLH